MHCCWSGKSTASHQLLPQTHKLSGDSPQTVGQTSSTSQAPPFPAPHLQTPMCLYLRAQRVSPKGSSVIYCMQQYQPRPRSSAQGPAPSMCASCVSRKGAAQATCEHNSSSGDHTSTSSESASTGSPPTSHPRTPAAWQPSPDRPRWETGQQKSCSYFNSNSSLALPTAWHAVSNHISCYLMLPLSGKGTGWLEHAPSICCVGVIRAWQGCCKALRWFIISRPRAKT